MQTPFMHIKIPMHANELPHLQIPALHMSDVFGLHVGCDPHLHDPPLQVSVRWPHASPVPHLQKPASQESVDPIQSASDWHCPSDKISIS